jgi:hypothetical protein
VKRNESFHLFEIRFMLSPNFLKFKALFRVHPKPGSS